MRPNRALVAVEEGRVPNENPTVLLAVCQPDEREAIGALLRELNLRVRHAATGQEAVLLLEESPYDALVMDIQQVDMHGWELLGKLREFVDFSRLPTVIIADEVSLMPPDGMTLVVRPVAMTRLRRIFANVLQNGHGVDV